MYNECIFFSQLFLISFFIIYFLRQNNILYLYIFSPILIILINLLVNKEIILFGMHTTCVEPLAVALFWIGSIIYIKDKEKGAKNLLNYNFIFSILTVCISYTVFLYNTYLNNIYDKIFYQFIYSIILSNITFFLSYFIERKIYNILKSQFISVVFSQFIDTFLYTILYFESCNKIKFEIIIFSFTLKFICICFYAYFIQEKIKN